MFMTRTAHIGLADLIPAMKTKENYVTYEKSTLDNYIKEIHEDENQERNAYKKKGFKLCKDVVEESVAKYEKEIKEKNPALHEGEILKKKYINEKARYGNKPELKINALLLFMALHFLHPSTNGFVQMDREEIKDLLPLSDRTIQNNLRTLEKHGYISHTKGRYPGHYFIFISRYKEYFFKANRGGRGYITITRDIMQHLANMNDVNEIRLFLRLLIESVQHGRAFDGYVERTFSEFRYMIPGYNTKARIEEWLNSPVFQAYFYINVKKYSVVFRARTNCDPNKIVNEMRTDCEERVKKSVNNINKIEKDREDKGENPCYMVVTESEYKDISKVSLKFPMEAIENAIRYIHDSYNRKFIKIKNLPSLVRRCVEAISKTEANHFLVNPHEPR